MLEQNNKIESLQLKLKCAKKHKVYAERRIFELRNIERSLCENILLTKAEIELLSDDLCELKDQIFKNRQQISMIEICKSSENAKTENHINYLMQSHKKGYDELFAKDCELSRMRNKELKEQEAEEEEKKKGKQKALEEKNEQQAREAATIEAECENLEGECVILKKRNNAIMLKLRRKLIESEDIRRKLIQKNTTNA